MLTGWKPNLSIDQGINLTIEGLRKGICKYKIDYNRSYM